jgi:hypothetical protein
LNNGFPSTIVNPSPERAPKIILSKPRPPPHPDFNKFPSQPSRSPIIRITHLPPATEPGVNNGQQQLPADMSGLQLDPANASNSDLDMFSDGVHSFESTMKARIPAIHHPGPMVSPPRDKRRQEGWDEYFLVTKESKRRFLKEKYNHDYNSEDDGEFGSNDDAGKEVENSGNTNGRNAGPARAA